MINSALSSYIRQHYPEYVDLTASEIFVLKCGDNSFINAMNKIYDSLYINYNLIFRDLIFIDLADFFERQKHVFTHDFINKDSFHFTFYFGNGTFGFSFNLYDEFSTLKDIFFKIDRKNNDSTISYDSENLKYNKLNFDYILLKYISFVKKDWLRSDIIFSSIFGRLTKQTDLQKFFHINLNTENNVIHINEFPMFYLKNNINYCIYIQKKKSFLYVLDEKSSVLFKTDLRFIEKKDFFKKIIEPLKNILFNFDDLRKKNYQHRWASDVSKYISDTIEAKDLPFVKYDIFPPHTKSIFLDKIIYSKRPEIEIYFILPNNEKSTCLMSSSYNYHDKDFLDKYKYYQLISGIHKDKLQLTEVITTKHSINEKKRL